MANLTEDDAAKMVKIIEMNQKNIRTLAKGMTDLQERVKELESKQFI